MPVYILAEDGEKTYVMDSILVEGEKARDVISDPLTESVGLDLSTTIINEAEIERQGAITIIDAMEFVPGSWIETRGRKVKQFFSIRGQKYPYPDYAIDGAYQREFLEMPYFFSASNIERIEVIRSSAALLKGLSGLTGIINIIPKKYDKPETSTEIEYGSFDTYRYHLSHGASTGKVSYAFDAGSSHADGPDDRNGAESITNFLGSVNYQPIRTISVKADLFHLYGKRELMRALPPAGESYQNTSEKYDPIQTTQGIIRAFFRPSDKVSTEAILSYADRDSNFYSEPGDPHKTTRDWDYELNANLTQAIALSKNNIIRVGGLYNHWVAPNGKRFYEGKRNDLETYSAVVVDEHKFDNLILDGGIRWSKTFINDYSAYNIQESMKGLQNVTPIKDKWESPIFNTSLGTAYYLSRNISLHLNFASGIIQPRAGTLDNDLKDPKNERRIKIDIGTRFASSKAGQLSIVGFYVQQKDAITLSGKTKEMNGQIMELYKNQDQDQSGVEFEARTIQLLGIIEPFINAVVMKSRVDVDGEMISNKEQPKLIISGGIYATKANLDVNVLWKHVSSYESTRFASGNPPISQTLGDYHALKATIGLTIGRKHQARLYLEIENLLDEDFSTVIGYPDLGRRFTIGLHQSFR